LNSAHVLEFIQLTYIGSEYTSSQGFALYTGFKYALSGVCSEYLVQYRNSELTSHIVTVVYQYVLYSHAVFAFIVRDSQLCITQGLLVHVSQLIEYSQLIISIEVTQLQEIQSMIIESEYTSLFRSLSYCHQKLK